MFVLMRVRVIDRILIYYVLNICIGNTWTPKKHIFRLYKQDSHTSIYLCDEHDLLFCLYYMSICMYLAKYKSSLRLDSLVWDVRG